MHDNLAEAEAITMAFVGTHELTKIFNVIKVVDELNLPLKSKKAKNCLSSSEKRRF